MKTSTLLLLAAAVLVIFPSCGGVEHRHDRRVDRRDDRQDIRTQRRTDRYERATTYY
jgi:hypothetical protein